jgi:peptidoglycan hydrolase-like protein with peptidoglycan-binding domain
LQPNPAAQQPTLQRHDLGPVPQQPSEDLQETARQLQTELQRVGCFSGKIDGIWNRRSIDAVKRFSQHAHLSLNTDLASAEAVAAIRGRTSRVCPLTCSRGQAPSGDRCVAMRQARPVQRDAPASSAMPLAPAAGPQSSDGPGKKRCVTYGGYTYCE